MRIELDHPEQSIKYTQHAAHGPMVKYTCDLAECKPNTVQTVYVPIIDERYVLH